MSIIIIGLRVSPQTESMNFFFHENSAQGRESKTNKKVSQTILIRNDRLLNIDEIAINLRNYLFAIVPLVAI